MLCEALAFDDVQVVGRPGSPEVAPIRAEGIFPTVTVRMGREGERHWVLAARRWRTG